MNRAERQERRKSIAEMCKLEPVSSVADHFKISDAMVRAACREHGVTPLPACDGTKSSSYAILKRLADGIPQVEIASEMKVSRQRVNQVAKSAREAGWAV